MAVPLLRGNLPDAIQEKFVWISEPLWSGLENEIISYPFREPNHGPSDTKPNIGKLESI
jgi:hypothetical protein